MAAHPKVTPEKFQRIAEVFAARRAVPSDKALARELGLTLSTIRWHIGKLLEAAEASGHLKLSKTLVSRGTAGGRLKRCLPPERSATHFAKES